MLEKANSKIAYYRGIHGNFNSYFFSKENLSIYSEEELLNLNNTKKRMAEGLLLDIETHKFVKELIKKLNVIEYLLTSPAILSLTIEEIIERVEILNKYNMSLIDKREKFNSIFGLSKKKISRKIIIHSK